MIDGKTIPGLPAIADILLGDTLMLPIDTGVKTYNVSLLQLATFFLASSVVNLESTDPITLTPISGGYNIGFLPTANVDFNSQKIINLLAGSDPDDAVIVSQLDDYILTSEKGVANGVVPLDGSALISSIYLPSYVDDILEFANLASFPITGETGKIYVALNTNKTYRWSGSSYIETSSSEVNSVNGRLGNVIGLAEDNTVVHLAGIETITGKKTLTGGLAIVDGTQGLGKVLTSDGSGNVSWATPSGASLSGTLNRIVKFTPNGSSGGNSNISDDGTITIVGLNNNTGSYNTIGTFIGGANNGTLGFGSSLASPSAIIAGDTFMDHFVRATNSSYFQFLNSSTLGLKILPADANNRVTFQSTHGCFDFKIGVSSIGDAYDFYSRNTADNTNLRRFSIGNKLDVVTVLIENANFKYTGSTPGLGKVLTSDAVGLASWQANTASLADISVSCTKNVQQSIAINTPTAIDFDGADQFDTDTMHDPSTNNTRITFTTAGKYALVADISLTSTNIANIRSIFKKNNTTTLHEIDDTTNSQIRQMVGFANFSAGDYVEIVMTYISGSGTLEIYDSTTRFKAYKIS